MELKKLKKGDWFVFPKNEEIGLIKIWKKSNYDRDFKAYWVQNIINKDELKLINGNEFVYKIVL